MKLYGYCVRAETDDERPEVLSEVTVCADPETLRKLSKFMLAVADAMEKHGESFGHEHFEDYDRSQPARPGFIVARDPSPGSSIA